MIEKNAKISKFSEKFKKIFSRKFLKIFEKFFKHFENFIKILIKNFDEKFKFYTFKDTSNFKILKISGKISEKFVKKFEEICWKFLRNF